MFGTQSDSMAYDHQPKTFAGVRFVLFGFHPVDAQQVRGKLVSEGGVDVRQYGPNCTHVIVHNLVYDDPICVAARSDGKILVTGLWVDHSYEIGMPADDTNVMYRPLRDLGGIPGAKSLVVCLTGYQRHIRDDIMTMVGLMGGVFSKPLAANKVTHLVCYKFEGDKYALAKKMQKIKIVNHQWLEDCLRAWEILPEENYDKSGYELEIMEGEAKDSEEEEGAQDIARKQYEERKMDVSPCNFGKETVTAQMSHHLDKVMFVTSPSKGLSTSVNSHGTILASKENTIPPQDAQEKQAQGLSSLGNTYVGDGTSGEPKSVKRFPTSSNIGSGLASASGSARRSPLSASKSSDASYYRTTPRRSTVPLLSGKLSHPKSSDKVAKDKLNVNDDFNMSSPIADHIGNGNGSECDGTPLKASNITLEECRSGRLSGKRKMDVSNRSSKSQKINHDQKACISGSPLVTNKSVLPETDGISNLNVALDAAANPGAKHCSPAKTAFSSYSRSGRKSLMNPVLRKDTSGKKEDNEGTDKTYFPILHTSLSSEPESKRFNGENVSVTESGKPLKGLQDVWVPDLETNVLVTEKSSGPTVELVKEGDCNLPSKPSRRKMVAKKSSGSGKRGSNNSKNQKGTLDLNKTIAQSDAETDPTCEREVAVKEGCEMINPTADIIDEDLVMETGLDNASANEVENRAGTLDDETEAPEDNEETVFEAREAKSKRKEDAPVCKKAEGMQSVDTHTRSSSTRMAKERSSVDKNKTSGVKEDGAELRQAAEGKKDEPEKPETKNGGKGKLTKLKKHPLAKASAKSLSSVTETKKPKEGTSGMESKTKKKSEKIRKKGNKPTSPSGKTNGTAPFDEMEVDKENRPSGMGEEDAGHENIQVSGVALDLNSLPDKVDSKDAMTDNEPKLAERVFQKKVDPSWFILSGHRIQRKEFQQVIKRLKGRLCRDSHQWSYQATHFIVPDPIRRTEKFFAAAASGRWILKTDYLTACNEAGKFVAEEPYEWHNNSLTEDGAISLEAPRKWRLLRERTGHGAFYGMRVIIYGGECILPPLDTLKRVIRAGEGTLLATSPPYTRFLNSGVDFAIVSPGMPRVDVWVQEFIRHDIPCVLADYLVEYVCKPGYPLEKHVQYNTHALAEKSLANLVSRSTEVVAEEEDYSESDVPCQVCGSRDRGDVMLICGDESGSFGCGVGTHIDCCDPPLKRVPDEDWFCSKCNEAKNSAKVVASSGTGRSSTKRSKKSRK